jgi:hypothetical protein
MVRYPHPSYLLSLVLFMMTVEVGIPKIMKSSRTIKTQVVSAKEDEIIFKLQQEYTPRLLGVSKKVNSLVTLTLDGEGRVRYHKVCECVNVGEKGC